MNYESSFGKPLGEFARMKQQSPFDADQIRAGQDRALSQAQGSALGVNTPKESELARELRRMDQACHALAVALDMLSDRLTPLMIPIPEAAGCAGDTSGPASEVGGRICNGSRSIEQADRRLRAIMDSLAV